MSSELRKRIFDVFSDVFVEHVGKAEVPQLEDTSVLLETGLDSLGFAILVVKLEEELGYDPFVLSEDAFYPRTFGEFVSFYEDNVPKEPLQKIDDL